MSQKKFMFVPVAVVAGVLAFTSIAWACTKFLGNFSISDTFGNTVTSQGLDDPAGFANGYQLLSGSPMAKTCGGLSTDSRCATGLGGTPQAGVITIKTARSAALPADVNGSGNPAIPGGTVLPPGTYTVGFANGPAYTSHDTTTTQYQYGSLAVGPATTGVSQVPARQTGQQNCYSPVTGVTGGTGVSLGSVTIDTNGEIAAPVTTTFGGAGLVAGAPKSAQFRLPPALSSATTNEPDSLAAAQASDGANYTGVTPGYMEESAVCVWRSVQSVGMNGSTTGASCGSRLAIRWHSDSARPKFDRTTVAPSTCPTP